MPSINPTEVPLFSSSVCIFVVQAHLLLPPPLSRRRSPSSLQGRVVAFIKESIDKHVYVKIEWSDKCMRDGDLKITRNQLKKTKWNPNVPVGGAWREDLYHKLVHKG
jgi:hypothetical protein